MTERERPRPFFIAVGTLAGILAIGTALSAFSDYDLNAIGNALVVSAFVGLALLFAPRFLPVVLRGRRRPLPLRFRLQVLRFLGAAARRGESPGAALAALAGDVSGRRRAAVLEVLGKVDGGASLGASLATPRARFLSLEGAAAVRAVEGTGRVADVIAAADAREPDWVAVRRRAGVGLLYAVVVLLVAWWMVVLILPQFFSIASQVVVQESSGAVVDWDWRSPRYEHLMLARGLKDAALVARVVPVAAWAALVLAFGAAAVGAFRRDPRTAPLVRGMLLWMPGLGRILRLDAAGRVLRVMGVLVSSGVPLHEVFSRAAPVAGAPVLAEALEVAAAGIAHGEPLARVAPFCGLPPFAAARLVAASGGPPESFGGALVALGGACEEKALAAAGVAASWCYPVVLVVAGGLAFLVYRSVFLVTGGYQEIIRPW